MGATSWRSIEAETTILGAGGLTAAPEWRDCESIVPECRCGEERRGSSVSCEQCNTGNGWARPSQYLSRGTTRKPCRVRVGRRTSASKVTITLVCPWLRSVQDLDDHTTQMAGQIGQEQQRWLGNPKQDNGRCAERAGRTQVADGLRAVGVRGAREIEECKVTSAQRVSMQARRWLETPGEKSRMQSTTG